ncbi:hypothetical protein BH11BAC6_BH11BAC6_02650 [soil metagenome]
MSKALNKKVDVFITVDLLTMSGYFNSHDPAPLYKRQIHQKFEEYIFNSVVSVKRYTVIFYKLNCPGAVDRQYVEPLMYAIRRHFNLKKAIKEQEFKKFKRRNYILLALSMAVVVVLQGLLPLVISEDLTIHSGLKNLLDIFSWVILWRPINELIFSWNPHLKDISLLKKLATAESLIIENELNTDIKINQKINNGETVKVNGTQNREQLMSV